VTFRVAKAGSRFEHIRRCTRNRIELIIHAVVDLIAHPLETASRNLGRRIASSGEVLGQHANIGMIPIDDRCGAKIVVD
jgi:hypothetical protein